MITAPSKHAARVVAKGSILTLYTLLHRHFQHRAGYGHLILAAPQTHFNLVNRALDVAFDLGGTAIMTHYDLP